MKDRSPDDLWTDGGADDLDFEAPASARPHPTNRTQSNAFFGCPLWWIQKVAPLVGGKSEVMTAIYLWRLRVICRSKTVVLANSRLLDELGVDRHSKYRALRRLERAGLVRVQRKTGAAPRVTFKR
jgi:hypothetical protein